MSINQDILITTLTILLCNVYFNSGCPPVKFYKPFCSCVDKEVTCQTRDYSLDQVTETLKRNILQPIKKLVFDGMKQGQVKLKNLEDIPFNKLVLSNCQLNSITDSGVVNMQYLKAISFESSIEDPQSIFIFQLQNLQKLDALMFKYNTIKRIKKDWFPRNLASLTFLSFYNDNVEEIEDHAFENLVNLRTLSLNKNNLKSLQTSILPSTSPSLSRLYLNWNFLADIPEDFFKGLKSLKFLDMRYNKIKYLPEKTYSILWPRLVFFSFKGNPLNCSQELRWMAQYPTPEALSGRCMYPEQWRGVQMITLIKILRKEFTLPPL